MIILKKLGFDVKIFYRNESEQESKVDCLETRKYLTDKILFECCQYKIPVYYLEEMRITTIND